MCGFAAFHHPEGLTPERDWLQGAAAALRHRGPDDEGLHLEPGVGLAFRRLAIVACHDELEHAVANARRDDSVSEPDGPPVEGREDEAAGGGAAGLPMGRYLPLGELIRVA